MTPDSELPGRAAIRKLRPSESARGLRLTWPPSTCDPAQASRLSASVPAEPKPPAGPRRRPDPASVTRLSKGAGGKSSDVMRTRVGTDALWCLQEMEIFRFLKPVLERLLLFRKEGDKIWSLPFVDRRDSGNAWKS